VATALLLLCFAQAHAVLFPGVDTGYIGTPDLFRLSAYLAVLFSLLVHDPRVLAGGRSTTAAAVRRPAGAGHREPGGLTGPPRALRWPWTPAGTKVPGRGAVAPGRPSDPYLPARSAV
jgi:hypothetical protein